MAKQVFRSNDQIASELSRHSNGSRGSRTSSKKSFKKQNDLHQGGMRSMSNSRSPDNTYVMSGNLLQGSPMKRDIDRRLNYQIYEQNSLAHREHLLMVMKKKHLKGSKQSKQVGIQYLICK